MISKIETALIERRKILINEIARVPHGTRKEDVQELVSEKLFLDGEIERLSKVDVVYDFEIDPDSCDGDEEFHLANKAVAKYLSRYQKNGICKWQYLVDDLTKEYKELRKLYTYIKFVSWVCPDCGEELRIYAKDGHRAAGCARNNLPFSNPRCKKCAKKYYKQVYPENNTFVVLRDLPYAEYLQTEHWQRVTESAKRRAGFKCQVCGAKGGELNTHHNTYDNKGAELPEDLVVLCKNCHALFHGNGDNNIMSFLNKLALDMQKLRDWAQETNNNIKAWVELNKKH